MLSSVDMNCLPSVGSFLVGVFCNLPGFGNGLGVCGCATSLGRAGSLAVRGLRAGYWRTLLSRLLAPRSRADRVGPGGAGPAGSRLRPSRTRGADLRG